MLLQLFIFEVFEVFHAKDFDGKYPLHKKRHPTFITFHKWTDDD